MQHSNLFQAVETQLDQHKEASQRLSVLDDVSGVLQPLKGCIATLGDKKGAHYRNTAERFVTALEQIMFVTLVCRRKIDAINELLRFSISTRNAIALAQGARSIVEHVAVLAEISRALECFEQQIKGQTEGTKIHDAMGRLEEFFARCYFGKSPKIEQNKSKQTLHISDCISTLEKFSPGFSDFYDYLCEFVHPNHGSNTLVSSLDVNVQVTSIFTDLRRPETQRMGEIVLSTLRTSEQLEFGVHAAIARLGWYANRFMQRESKIQNIFAERKIKPIGDGKSKETAFFFPGARDIHETSGLWAKYLETRKISILSCQTVMEHNVAFDLYETTQGQLWHRIEYPLFDDEEGSEK